MFKTASKIPGPIGRSIRRAYLRSYGFSKQEADKQVELENSKAFKVTMAQFKHWK